MREVKWSYGWGRVGHSCEERQPWPHLAFAVSEYEGRVEKVRRLRRERGLDGLVVPGNRAERAPVPYLSNFEDYHSGDTLSVISLAGPAGLRTNAVTHEDFLAERGPVSEAPEKWWE